MVKQKQGLRRKREYGSVNKRGKRLRRHGAVLVLSLLIFWGFWAARSAWTPDMRIWKAAGDVAFTLLWLTLLLGPLAKLVKVGKRWLVWRRQLGIWFAAWASLHAVLILNGWARWSVSRFFGYEYIAELGREARWEPGFGLANLLGLTALIVGLVLAATSSDWALRWLRAPGWKFLHTSAYFVFYVGALHSAYFLFIHYTVSFHKQVPDADWFQLWFLAMLIVVSTAQLAGFVRTVIDARRRT